MSSSNSGRGLRVLAAGIALVTLCGGFGAFAAPSAQAGGRKGVAVCLLNDSTARVKVDWISSDTRTRDGWIPAGDRACAEGTFAWRADLAMRVTWADGLSARLDFNNPLIGYPTVTMDP